MGRINIIYLSPWSIGGSTSFTVHLYHSLIISGVDVKVYKLGSRTENRERELGSFKVPYRILSSEDLVKEVKNNASVLTAPSHSKNLKDPNIIKKLIKVGMRVVVHDPNEFKYYDHLEHVTNPIIIRKASAEYFKGSVLIPHPYVRKYQDKKADVEALLKRKVAGVCTTLITKVKNPATILDCNRITKLKKYKIHFKGSENRLYTFRGIKDKYPEFEGSAGFPRELHASTSLCREAVFSVDLTNFGNDGGDSSYSIMECMDAGSLLIVHKGWIGFGGRLKNGVNCFSITTGEELAETILRLLKRGDDSFVNSIIDNGYKFLNRHNPKKIAKKYVEELL